MEGFERVVVCGVSFDLAYVLRVEDPARFPRPLTHIAFLLILGSLWNEGH